MRNAASFAHALRARSTAAEVAEALGRSDEAKREIAAVADEALRLGLVVIARRAGAARQ